MRDVQTTGDYSASNEREQITAVNYQRHRRPVRFMNGDNRPTTALKRAAGDRACRAGWTAVSAGLTTGGDVVDMWPARSADGRADACRSTRCAANINGRASSAAVKLLHGSRLPPAAAR